MAYREISEELNIGNQYILGVHRLPYAMRQLRPIMSRRRPSNPLLPLRYTLGLRQAFANQCNGSYDNFLDAIPCQIETMLSLNWFVCPGNLSVAVHLLPLRQHEYIRVVSGMRRDEILPVAGLSALAKTAKNCLIDMLFYDTFCNPQDPSKDREQLEFFRSNKTLRINLFLGYLDPENIARLPSTIVCLGLAITNAAEARAVSSLNVWDDLEVLCISISSSVKPEHLRLLPTVDVYRLYFLDLTDAHVDMVRPAIDALMYNDPVNSLTLVECQMTDEGLCQLAQKLQGLQLKSVSVFSIPGLGTKEFQVGALETDSVSTAFQEVTDEFLRTCGYDHFWMLNRHLC